MNNEPARRNQHLVSRGYQLNFADHGRLTIFNAHSGVIVDERRPVKENWRELDFVSIVTSDGYIDDRLERYFAKKEGRVLDQIRRIKMDQKIDDAHKVAVDLLAAIHLVRSTAFVSTHEEVIGKWLRDGALDLATDKGFSSEYEKFAGRPPVDGELEVLVRDAAQRMAEDDDLVLSGMRRGMAQIPRILAASGLQLVATPPPLPGFVLPDQPVVHAIRDSERFGFRDGLAVGDADMIVLPLDRRLAVFYSRKPLRNVLLKTQAGLDIVNSALCRGAVAEIACHPDDRLYVARLLRRRQRISLRRLTDGTLK